MFGRSRQVFWAAITLGLFVIPSLAQAEDDAPKSPPNPTQLRTEAKTAEAAGRWDKALDAYLKLYVAGPTADLREHIRTCLRNAAQLRRHREPAFQQFVLALPVADALNIYAEVLTKLGTLYADRDKAATSKLFALGLEELDRAIVDPAFRKRHLDGDETAIETLKKTLQERKQAKMPTNPRAARQAALDLTAAAQTAGVRNPSAVILELICGACSGLDEYTVYVAPTGPQADLAAPIAEFAAYGVLVAFREGEFVVDGIVPGSWAASHTPLRKGDRIARVNGRSVFAGDAAGLAEAVRSAAAFGHDLELAGTKDMMGLMVRLPVPLPTVYAGDIVQMKDGVGYLRLSNFRDTTPRELDEAILSLKARGMRSLVLDVRGNPGGAFAAAVMVAQRFLPAGVVVTTQGQSPEFAGRVFSSDAGMTAWDFPLVLLTDTKTMSAAEVVAVALKEQNRATLVGMPTFGKGAVQCPIGLHAIDGVEGKGGVLVLTVATVAGPRGGQLNNGVSPHIFEPDPVRQLEQAVAKAAELTNR